MLVAHNAAFDSKFWDAELGLFDRDRPTTHFPVQRLGYMEVARVAEWLALEDGP